MSPLPDTRHSLLVRLRDRDEAAWEEFLEIYDPLLWRVVRKQGLPESEVADTVQEILLAVYRSIDRFEKRERTGEFRTWLASIAKNTSINFLVRRLKRQATGGTSFQERLVQMPDPSESLSQVWETEHRKQWIDWAAKRVASEVERPHTQRSGAQPSKGNRSRS